METKYIKIILWTALIIWMGVIFLFSAQNASESADLSGGTIRKIAELTVRDFGNLSANSQFEIINELQHIVRKLAHLTIYMILGVLAILVLFQHSVKHRSISAMAICVGYAISDEVHQTFVDGRGGQITDVFIDSCGSLIGISLVLLIWRLYYCRRKKC